mmetsp:Transcript_19242/g.22080  ORF Transcript_19242/g.22080 Transcript_19242/m.22080 type:complete len:207 (+) Transcript_19242:21-641(+)
MNKREFVNSKGDLEKSRLIWNDIANDEFLRTLYRVLENPKYHNIISWNESGTAIELKDRKRLKKEIFPLFKICPAMPSFYLRLEDCEFIKAIERSTKQITVYEHLFYESNRRPAIDIRITKKCYIEYETEKLEEEALFRAYPRKEIKKAIDQEESGLESRQEFDLKNELLRSELPRYLQEVQLSNEIKSVTHSLKVTEMLLKFEQI